MNVTKKLTAVAILSSVLVSGASAYAVFVPRKVKGATIGLQTKFVDFDSKLKLDDKNVYGIYYDINFDPGEPLAWGVKIGFSLDYASMKDDDGKSFGYYDYYAKIAPTYSFGVQGGNIRVYAGAKFGYNGFESTTGYTYGAIGGVEFNYKAINAGINYFKGTTDINGLDFDISEAGVYVGYNF
jgi:hypothetical protein